MEQNHIKSKGGGVGLTQEDQNPEELKRREGSIHKEREKEL